MMKYFLLAVIGVGFSGVLFAPTVEVETPEGKISVRITDETRKEKIEFTSPTVVNEQIKKNLRKLRNIYIAKLISKTDREKANSLIDEIEDLVSLLYVWVKEPVPVKPTPTKPVETIQPMSSSSFKTLLTNLKKEAFSEDKLNLLKQASQNNYFVIDQLLQIMDTFDSDPDKIEAVRIIYPKIIDKKNAFKLQSKVTFSGSKEEISAIIAEDTE